MEDGLGRAAPGRVRLQLCVAPPCLVDPESADLLVGQEVQALQQRLCELRAVRDGKFERFGFQVREVHGT
jgi:hypothetical protein